MPGVSSPASSTCRSARSCQPSPGVTTGRWRPRPAINGGAAETDWRALIARPDVQLVDICRCPPPRPRRHSAACAQRCSSAIAAPRRSRLPAGAAGAGGAGAKCHPRQHLDARAAGVRRPGNRAATVRHRSPRHGRPLTTTLLETLDGRRKQPAGRAPFKYLPHRRENATRFPRALIAVGCVGGFRIPFGSSAPNYSRGPRRSADPPFFRRIRPLSTLRVTLPGKRGSPTETPNCGSRRTGSAHRGPASAHGGSHSPGGKLPDLVTTGSNSSRTLFKKRPGEYVQPSVRSGTLSHPIHAP
jgi:hypothetical protein